MSQIPPSASSGGHYKKQADWRNSSGTEVSHPAMAAELSPACDQPTPLPVLQNSPGLLQFTQFTSILGNNIWQLRHFSKTFFQNIFPSEGNTGRRVGDLTGAAVLSVFLTGWTVPRDKGDCGIRQLEITHSTKSPELPVRGCTFCL